MSAYNLIEELYRLATEMTVLNDYNFDWSISREWENGGAIMSDTPTLHIIEKPEQNNDQSNGVGNNFQQLIIPVEIKFGKTLTTPSDDFLKTTKQLNELKSKLVTDINKMYSSPYKVSKANVPEYCGTEYTGEGNTEQEEQDLDAYTAVKSMEFDIIYKRSREING